MKFGLQILRHQLRSSKIISRTFSGDVNKNFEASLNRLKKSDLDLNSTVKLKLYAYYKQASDGPCNIPEPGYFDIAGQAKHQAWKSLGTKGKKECMEEYIAIVNDLLPTSHSQINTTDAKKVAIPSAEVLEDNDPYSIENVAYPRRQNKVVSALKLETVITTEMQGSPGVYTLQLNRPGKGD